MRQFDVHFFDRSLTYKHRDSVYDPIIDDDYISAVTNNIDISSTSAVKAGYFVHITNDDINFFGLVTDVSPGEAKTTVTYKPFITLFDEDFLFYCYDQGTGSVSHPDLETAIYNYIRRMYVTTSDTAKRLNLEVVNNVSEANRTTNWSFYILPDSDTSNYNVANLYSDILVNALKRYGVAVRVEPVFSQKKIVLTIEKRLTLFNIDADLDNVVVKTLKYNDRPTGVNKLIVYNSSDYTQSPIVFYVHPDRSWDLDNERRITPVVTKISCVSPNDQTSFAEAALDSAYSTLSGAEWDNLIELETVANDPLIHPMTLRPGQVVCVRYKTGSYTSILTGKKIEGDLVTLLFGSERIQYSKRTRRIGG